MKVLSIGTDRKLFDETSQVLERQREYASKLDELHIVVFSLAKDRFEKKQIGNLFLYPTNSNSKITYVSDAMRISKTVAMEIGLNKHNSVVTCQDPFETALVGSFVKESLVFHCRFRFTRIF